MFRKYECGRLYIPFCAGSREHKFWSPRAIFIIPYKNNNSDVDFHEKNIGFLTISSVEKYFAQNKITPSQSI